MQTYRTALVTGASSGIGEAFARELAATGCDLVLVARRAELLESLAAELRGVRGVAVSVLPADLTEPADIASVEKRFADRDEPIDLVINNAGVGTVGKLASLPVEGEDRQIRLNVLALARLTHAALPGMLERGHGGILNVSSVAGLLSAPGAATYGATKAFVTNFTESVHMEAKPHGVHVTALLPGFTRTEMHGYRKGEDGGPSGPAWLDADKVVREGLRAVAAGRAICVPGAQYKAVPATLRLLPRAALRRIIPRVWGG